MDNNKIQLIGAPCGHHGPYTFYKAFKYTKNGKCRILALSDFFFVKLWSDSDLLSIGELQLLWMDKNSEQVLTSLRLYFLPENTPEGRNDDHGEDEVLAISEKVVLRVADLLERILDGDGARWERGLNAVWERDCPPRTPLLVDSALDFSDVLREKKLLGDPDEDECAVVVLSFPRYCRYRAILKRLEGVANKWLHNTLVVALGGFAVTQRNTRVLFCKDTFDYPDLEGHELLCNHLAPNLKGRPRRKRKKRSLSPGGSESNESESSLSTVSSATRGRQQSAKTNNTEVVRAETQTLEIERRKTRNGVSPEEKSFLLSLHGFMRMRETPISRVPHLGFKEIDLFAFFSKVQKLGGYHSVTANRMWKPIYDELGGHQGSTSAATYTRRHYERLLLPYERSVREAKGKLNLNNHLKLKAIKEPEKKDVPAGSGKPVKESKQSSAENVSASDCKPTSLRSVRSKSEKSNGPDSGSNTGKENIPLSNRFCSQADMKQESSSDNDNPEVIDLVSDQDSPVKIGKTPLPALKKRKLDILKEGGLEVTAITSNVETSVGSITIMPERRPSVIQHVPAVPSVENQVSITVTPDLSHMIDMLGSPTTDAASTPSPSPSYEAGSGQRYSSELKIPSVQNVYSVSSPPPVSSLHSNSSCDGFSPPKVVQSCSIYARSETVVYGNPKDEIDSPRQNIQNCFPVKVMPSVEVLDLRKKISQKPVVTVSRIPSGESSSNNTPNRTSKSHANSLIIGGRAMVGSNLEITVVDIPKNSSHNFQQKGSQQKHLHQQNQKKLLNKTVHSKLNSINENGKLPASLEIHRRNSTGGNTSLIIPNPYLTSNHRKNGSESAKVQPQQQRKISGNSPDSVPYISGNNSVYPGYLSQLSGTGNNATKSSSPYLSMLDPLYYPSVYGTSREMFSSTYITPVPVANGPPVFSPTAEQLKLYKELLSHHHNTLQYSPQTAGNFLGLLRDGSTSITPVGQTQIPTSK